MKKTTHHLVRAALLAALLSLAFGVQPAHASAIASLEYVETALAGGLFQYDYTLHNLADPATDPADAGRDIWDVFVAFPVDTLVSVVTPVGWDTFGGIGFDFLEAISQTPGTTPPGTDIAPGASLSGLRLVFNQQARSLPFSVTFVNPGGPEANLAYTGVTTASAAAPAPVPEPGTLLLLGSGLSTVGLLRRRRRPIDGREPRDNGNGRRSY
jgi:hypothetical protein